MLFNWEYKITIHKKWDKFFGIQTKCDMRYALKIEINLSLTSMLPES